MNLGNFIDISEKIDSINTSESYSEKCYFNGNSLLIPYIKLEIIDKNVIENSEDNLNVEFSYLILVGINKLHWIGEDENGKKIVGGITLKGNKEKAELKDWFAFFRENNSFEIKAIFEKLIIFIPANSRIGKDWWTPWKTPNFPQNIKTEKVKDFFELKNVPKKLNERILIESFSTLQFENGMNEQIELIEKNWVE